MRFLLLLCFNVPRVMLCHTSVALMCRALDILSGMRYLETSKIVHRDLAARNLLVTASDNARKKYTIKVSGRTPSHSTSSHTICVSYFFAFIVLVISLSPLPSPLQYRFWSQSGSQREELLPLHRLHSCALVGTRGADVRQVHT